SREKSMSAGSQNLALPPANSLSGKLSQLRPPALIEPKYVRVMVDLLNDALATLLRRRRVNQRAAADVETFANGVEHASRMFARSTVRQQEPCRARQPAWQRIPRVEVKSLLTEDA